MHRGPNQQVIVLIANGTIGNRPNQHLGLLDALGEEIDDEIDLVPPVIKEIKAVVDDERIRK
ncbi:hypothetical protein SLEP1_g8034 [Rubroshorea leprosula]|uniref:Uncharacterized protein n=1 Tax=Rubroshorea leprosula TaxID=152421 RepID=A0AAV5IBB3_9ROSI|nr:hypothetical protein SLEP1_g8034 [Rubroshorea leprosula]